MKRAELRSGYTTGACAAAAASGAARMLRTQQLQTEAEIVLPRGEKVTFPLQGQQFATLSARCSVIKDAGDDPDITNGAEITVTVRKEARHNPGGVTAVFVLAGEGVGQVTKPGLAVAVGEPAINPVPRQMITAAVKEEFSVACHPETLYVTVSIPNGAELAKKTLNARLGIIGGLSILGTTGIVRPVSAQAWTDTIDTSIDVALASGTAKVILSTGRTSELTVQKWLSKPDSDMLLPVPGPRSPVPEEAYVMMGDFFGHAVRSCAAKGVKEIILAGQFAKLLKIACGHEQTHVLSSELDLQVLAEWLSLAPCAVHLMSLAQRANTARQLLVESGNDPELMNIVCSRARDVAARLAEGVVVKVLLAGYNAQVLYFKT